MSICGLVIFVIALWMLLQYCLTRPIPEWTAAVSVAIVSVTAALATRQVILVAERIDATRQIAVEYSSDAKRYQGAVATKTFLLMSDLQFLGFDKETVKNIKFDISLNYAFLDLYLHGKQVSITARSMGSRWLLGCTNESGGIVAIEDQSALLTALKRTGVCPANP